MLKWDSMQLLVGGKVVPHVTGIDWRTEISRRHPGMSNASIVFDAQAEREGIDELVQALGESAPIDMILRFEDDCIVRTITSPDIWPERAACAPVLARESSAIGTMSDSCVVGSAAVGGMMGAIGAMTLWQYEKVERGSRSSGRHLRHQRESRAGMV